MIQSARETAAARGAVSAATGSDTTATCWSDRELAGRRAGDRATVTPDT